MQISMFDKPSNDGNNGELSFTFGDSPIRVVKDANGEPLFVAVDVAKAIGIKNSRDALTALDDDQKADVGISYTSGKKTLAAVTESGLYQLIFSGRKEAARKFSRWVTDEVLPQIRRTGSYIPEPDKPIYMPPRTPNEKATYAVAILRDKQDHQSAAARVTERKEGITELKTLQATINKFVVIGGKPNYGLIFDNEYMGLFGAFTKQLKVILGVPNVRNGLSDLQLQYLRLAESSIAAAIQNSGQITPNHCLRIVNEIVIPLGKILDSVNAPLGLPRGGDKS